MWKCNNCHHLDLAAEKPERCPVCGAEAEKLVPHEVLQISGTKALKNLKPDDKLIILTDMALGEKEIDEAATQVAIERAEEQLKTIDHNDNLEDFTHLQGLIAQNLAKLNLKRKRRN